MPQRILLVGHCGVDGPRLQRGISANFKSVRADRINSMDDLQAACAEGADLLLVNREPLGFEPLSGVDVIRQLHEVFPGQKAMLVSDYDDAQEEAEEAGALPGFGKADIDSPKFAEAVGEALGA